MNNAVNSEIILASASPRRSEILSNLGVSFSVIKSTVKEQYDSNISPFDYVMEMAKLKACDVATEKTDNIVIGADTIVVLQEKVLEKPTSSTEAIEMLELLSNRTHKVMTALCMTLTSRNEMVSGICETEVTFKKLLPHEIEWYIRKEEFLDKAGAYGIQGKAGLFIEKIKGCYFNVVGFPVNLFYRLITSLDEEFLREI